MMLRYAYVCIYVYIRVIQSEMLIRGSSVCRACDPLDDNSQLSESCYAKNVEKQGILGMHQACRLAEQELNYKHLHLHVQACRCTADVHQMYNEDL